MASQFTGILAEGAIALSVTLSGGALVANLKLFQVVSSLIVNVILATCERAFGPIKHTICSYVSLGRGRTHALPARRVLVMSQKVISLVYVWCYLLLFLNVATMTPLSEGL